MACGTEGITLQEGNVADSYNYLGTLQADKGEPSARKGTTAKYLQTCETCPDKVQELRPLIASYHQIP